MRGRTGQKTFPARGRGEGQNNHGRDEGHHVVDVAGPAEVGQEGGVGDVGQALKDGKEHGRPEDVEGLPLAKDHDRQRQEAGAGHADLKVPGLDRRHDVGHAADGAQRARDQNAGVAHLVDVDAHRGGRLRVLAAGPQPQAEAGLVHHHKADDEQHQAQRDKDTQLQPADVEQEGPVGVVQLGAAALAEILGEDHRHRGGQQVQGGAADGLVGLQVDGGEGQQQGIDHAGHRRRQNGHHHDHPGRHTGRQQRQGQNAGHAADDHDAFQRDVDDAGMLAEHTAQRHQHQDDAVQQGIFDE